MNEDVIEEVVHTVRDISYRIYRQLGSGLREVAYREALSAELQLQGYSTQTEVSLTYKYELPNGKVVNIGSGKADVIGEKDSIILIVEVKVYIPFLYRQIISRPVSQLTSYVKAMHIDRPDNFIIGALVNFPVPRMLVPELYFAIEKPIKKETGGKVHGRK